MVESAATRRLTLADFLGRWRMSRRITQADGAIHRFNGHAEWRGDESGADYVEAGCLQLPAGQTLQAERRFRWGADLSVWFEDGRFFHHVPRDGDVVAHACAPDRYLGAYDFTDWPHFIVSWQVAGPRKAYQMRTRYTRD